MYVYGSVYFSFMDIFHHFAQQNSELFMSHKPKTPEATIKVTYMTWVVRSCGLAGLAAGETGEMNAFTQTERSTIAQWFSGSDQLCCQNHSV